MKIVVFSDLDGTLLDHSNYSFDAAKPALAVLKKHAIPLVLASSKTAKEIADLHDALGLGQTPAIVENGAGFFDPARGPQQDDAAYQKIRATLDGLPAELRTHYRGFGDMSVDEVAQSTGLSPDAAASAKARCFSEPGLWSGSDTAKVSFQNALLENGISAREGGRYLTLSFGRTKADAMAQITAQMGADKTIALGDAPNDVEMLELANHPVLIRNDQSPAITLKKPSNELIKTKEQGPAGWNTAVLAILKSYSLQ